MLSCANKALIITFVSLGPKLGDYLSTKEELDQRCEQVFKWVADGELDVSIDKVFNLENAKDGHAYLEAGQSKGKVLFKVGINPKL